MEKYFDVIKKCPLFAGIEDADLLTLLDCLNAKQRNYKKNKFVFSVGDNIQYVGVVLSGSVHILQEDYWGNRVILANIDSSNIFGEAFSCAEISNIPVSVIAAEDSEILLVDYKKIITTCSTSCSFHMKLIKNMIKLLAQKNVALTQKIEIVTLRTTRERLMAYLYSQAMERGEARFTIPFNRQQLADFLSVDRSAMSRELSNMQADGLIRTTKNEFEIFSK